MSWPNKKAFSIASVLFVIFSVIGCGVKGDPLPPEKPLELGRGRPTYKRAIEGIKIEKKRPAPARQKEDEDEQE